MSEKENDTDNIDKLVNANKNKNWVIGVLISIIVLIAAALCTSICITSPLIKSYLSNAAQLTSIVLAIVAIVYAFSQTIQSQNQYNMMNRTLQDIENKIVMLQAIKEETIGTRQEVNKLTNEISSVVEDTKQNLPNKEDEKVNKELDRISRELERLKKNSTLKWTELNLLNTPTLLSPETLESLKPLNSQLTFTLPKR